MLLELQQIIVNPGQQMLLKDISWPQLENILEEMGERRAARISYSDGWLEIMVPLPEHEKDKEIFGELVRILLDKLEIDFEPFGSTTLKNERMRQAVEPDTSFYIQNQAAVIGKNRIDLNIEPPPDLAIEIDITSRTRFDNYEILGVPEFWRYQQQGLEIFLLQEGKYIKSQSSPNFPNIPIIELVNEYVRQCLTIGRSQAMRNFRSWVKDNLYTQNGLIV
ncbi:MULTISPECIES: Uma2 family endonuclease [unclassified Dolichospermum]|uniref:Uma2 family endonuclease n=1 Tax=unclassified Dolichospermum TaxID=2622029 RepID=UPI0014475BE2|nr:MULTISPECIES: Uma2 family endonuclease [unclassified Dolichospermum]MTJ16060.1 Uma2 family endonuclease [Dolichospermum sp. UHCC 0299]MTJ22453.1 Uma2 family endonuclease [Dolichospermum sp. UHCC 0352]MTJ38940.1 Uma2 family endonuclease [Dolichospermum sp. UHCC 0406]